MEKLQLKDFLQYKFLSGLEFAPGGEHAAFVTHESNYEENCYNSNIWLLERKSKNIRRLTGLDAEKSFVWLDKDNILFKADRDKKITKKTEEGEPWSSWYVLNIHGGEAQKYMDIPMTVFSLKVIDADTFAILAEYDKRGIDLRALKDAERVAAVEEIKEAKDYEVLDEIPFWSNGEGFTNQKRKRLYIWRKGEGTLTPVSGENFYVRYWTCVEGKILYVGCEFHGKLQQTSGIFRYDVESQKETVLLEDKDYMVEFAEFLGEDVICGLASGERYGLNENPKFYLLKDGKPSLLKDYDAGLGNSVGSDCRYGGGKDFRVVSRKLYFPITSHKSSFVHSIDEKGKETCYTDDKGSVDCYDAADDEIIFVGMRDNRLQELYAAKEGKIERISSFNEEFFVKKTVVKPEPLNITNDGAEIEGWVLTPADYDPGKKYPAILDIHGGPKTAYGETFFHEMQVWANMGYFVFFCNPRGSDGKGDAFADIRGKYGTIDYDDLMKFTDAVLAKYPAIDSGRLGVTGGSYGGYMTNWIIGHTDRFKCAASQRSIANWISKFGTTDIGYYFNADQNQSTPWINHDKLWWHSPMKYADQVKTPTLFIHSEQDYRCWLAEGIQMFTSLRYHGVEARLCMFRGENHELSRSGKPKHRIRRLEEITNWFEKYLK
ncbi:MAG: S9 family peptidase [Fusobacteriaceae bacterium]|jgi:acylaminoacyl-peptidase|nr:S9 family peptidase [Fusobacteriaceae bacterium]